MPQSAEGVQVEIPKRVRSTDSWEVHDPLVLLLKRPRTVSQLGAPDFEDLSNMGCLCAPCPKERPPCGTTWKGLDQSAHIHSLAWSQEVKTRIYCCACPEAHTIYYNGESLGLYTWTRNVIVTQESCQRLLRIIQNTGSATNALIASEQEVRRLYSPGGVSLSEESWRKASLAFFRLCGRSILECCSICGIHPEVMLCDGIAGLACADGGRQKGGLAGTSTEGVRPFTAPSRDEAGAPVVKTMEAGTNFCSVALDGHGLKRRLVHQPEVRALLARFSQHHPGDPLCNKEYDELLVALERDDVEVVSDFMRITDYGEDEDPMLFHWRRRILTDQIGQIRLKNRAVLTLLEGIEAEVIAGGGHQPIRCPKQWREVLYGLGAPFGVSDDSNPIRHGLALGVVRKMLLGEAASAGNKVILAEHAPILRRLLDHSGDFFPTYFLPALHHLYRLTLFGRGAVGLGVGRAGWAHSAVEGLDLCVWLERSRMSEPGAWWNDDRQQAYAFWKARANMLLPGVETLKPPPPEVYPLNQAESVLLNERLGLQPDGNLPQSLPPNHPFGQEQRALGCYPLPGWEQLRPTPQYKPFEDELGTSVDRSEEHRCKTGLTVGAFDAKIAAESGSKSAKRLQQHTKGGFVFCCPHRVIYGFHVMLRGESPRDPFTVLYTRLHRHHLPRYLIYDNACKLHAYCMRREPAFFADVRFLVDRFHFQKTGCGEAHKCGPSFNPDYYDPVEGSGQRPIPFTSARGLVTIINLLPGKKAAQFRLKCADVVVRYLGGDESLVAEIRRNKEVQSQLPAEHPARVFGETVEAEGGRADPEEIDLLKKIKRQKLENELASEQRKLETHEQRKLANDALQLQVARFEIGANTFRHLAQDAPPVAVQIRKGVCVCPLPHGRRHIHRPTYTDAGHCAHGPKGRV
ncbi:hypothetical protein KFL_002930020 [Klebsormidium nitens]|uniref:Uncharacterized protein n=1 Tax=Klebsormidium nitens TaxID=105231 RepID=A0A1Y1I6C1_KLENI|nr:hypothetical protein KFL_002930020 [Klebsormidium nitens]|eukprot:GAQ86505.1 hypothetical protein KFL_002930020 [Klebsormidium nitens]